MPSPEKFLVEAKEVAPIGDELVPKLEGNIDLALKKFYSRKILVAEKDLPESVSSEPSFVATNCDSYSTNLFYFNCTAATGAV